MGEVLCKPDKDEARRAVEGSNAPMHRYDQLEDASPRDGDRRIDEIAVPFAQRVRLPPARPDMESEKAPAHHQTRQSPPHSPTSSPRHDGRQTFVPVGEGVGNYEQRLDTKLYGCQAKRWVLLSALGAAMVLIAILLFVIFGRGTTYDCSPDAGLPSAWTQDQRDWCCEASGLGCPTTMTTTTLPFDCKADFYDWRNLWSPGKKAWCCDHFGLGCPETTTSVPYACTAGKKNWENEWSIAKKAWCCEHQYVGCPTDVRTTTGATTMRQSTDASETSKTYDCDTDLDNWSQAWSPHQRAWCCEFQKRGCPTLPPVLAV